VAHNFCSPGVAPRHILRVTVLLNWILAMQHLSDERLSPAREQEAFRAMFEQAGFGVAQVSLDGEWLAVNQALCDILGYSRTELLSQPLPLIARFDDVRAEILECHKLLESRIRSFSSQKRHLRRDGRVVWLKVTVTLVRDDITGEPESYLGIIEDRTLHRKAIQQALSESGKSFRVLTENISDLFFTLDLDLNFSFWNRAAESLTGILSSAVLGKGISEAFSDGQDARGLEELCREVLAARLARSFRFPCRIGEKDFLFEVTAYPSMDGISVVARDVASSKRAEEALRRSEEKFSKAFQASPAMITIVRISDRQYIEVNRAFETQTGFQSGEVIGRSISEIAGRDGLQSLNEAFEQAVEQGSVRNMEALVGRKESEPLIVLLSAEVMEFDGQPCVLMVGEDISERKQAELERAELPRRLMTAQEAERRRIARELHDGIGQSLALLGIQLQRAGQLSASGKRNPGVAELGNKVKEIGNQVSRLSHQLHSSELEFLGLAVAVKSLCREFSEQYDTRIDCACSKIPAELDNGIALSLLRVVQEALHNIVKHSRASSVTVYLTGHAGGLSLSISDDGIGFVVGSIGSSRGLGLISMRERVRLVGGKFEISSKPGAGTRIEAKVPLLASER
jgi:PAS domain S-box-containing protein